ncbi:unnamed protein product, partial [Rotaria socialis]
MAQQTP